MRVACRRPFFQAHGESLARVQNQIGREEKPPPELHPQKRNQPPPGHGPNRATVTAILLPTGNSPSL